VFVQVINELNRVHVWYVVESGLATQGNCRHEWQENVVNYSRNGWLASSVGFCIINVHTLI